MSTALQSATPYLVTDSNPPQDIDGMDHARCAFLHNAILLHAWTSSGRNSDDFLTKSRPGLEWDFNIDLTTLHPSVIAFLKTARALPPNHGVHFFYNVQGLMGAVGGA